MPHVVVKLATGRSEEQKTHLAAEITRSLVAILQCEEAAVSVAMEEVEPQAWTKSVYQPEILGKWETLYKKPGYTPQDQ